ncbi:MAG: hypothetical protein KF758_10005 [Anaerolineales bacterium]|nr:hypothetical protein [Anaerolineales bacterium]MBX3037233.1 hypothetical protein [Anaerolineales bacterium]
MLKNITFWLVFFSFMFLSCASPSPTSFSVTPGNIDEYIAPTYTPRPIPTPFQKSTNGEIVLLLRKRAAPFEVLILRLPDTCLLSNEICNVDGNLLGVLPQSLSHVLKVYWSNKGDKAFFWDNNVGDIYVLDGNKGVFTVFEEKIQKVRDDFFISPNGENIVFEIQKGDFETELVMMNSVSGDILKFDISIQGAKYISQWIDNHTVLFWNEVSEGKGYLVDLKVYKLNTLDHTVQLFDIGRDWMKTSVPVLSPNKNFIVFTTETQTITRDIHSSAEIVWNVRSEKSLWSMDSSILAIYNDSSGKIYTVFPNSADLQAIYSLPMGDLLADWIWLPDNQHILLAIADENESTQLGILSIEKKTFTPINLSLLSEYVPVSFSFRP